MTSEGEDTTLPQTAGIKLPVDIVPYLQKTKDRERERERRKKESSAILL
jgi:hypothetical protein